MINLPNDWNWHTIEDLIEDEKGSIKIGPFGSSLRKSDLSKTGYKVYGQENVISDEYSLGDRYIDETKFSELHQYEIRPGDFLITMMGTIGNTSIVPPEIARGIIDSHLIRIRLRNDIIDSRYLASFFKSRLLCDQIESLSRGAIMSGLNTKTIKKIMVPLPPLETQRKIVAILDKVESLKRLYEDSIVSLEILLDSLTQKAFKGELIK